MSLRMIRTSLVSVACVVAVACGFDQAPQTNTSPPVFTPTGGTSPGTAGTAPAPTAGTFGSAGDTGTGGTFGTAGTFGTGGETGGSASGGTAGTTAGTVGTAGTAPAAGSGGTGGQPAVCPMPGNAELPLPLTVSGNFIPSGYFAGPETNIPGIVAGTCEARPGTHTIGECYKFTFQAAMLDAAGTGAYGGVFWQNTANNWGTGPGTKVTAGATKVNFKAWGAAGGEVVTFSAGGITGVCSDGVNLGNGGGTQQTLTTTPTAYSVALGGQSYPNGIIGGFVWSTAVTATDQVVSFYVDEIQWVQ